MRQIEIVRDQAEASQEHIATVRGQLPPRIQKLSLSYPGIVRSTNRELCSRTPANLIQALSLSVFRSYFETSIRSITGVEVHVINPIVIRSDVLLSIKSPIDQRLYSLDRDEHPVLWKLYPGVISGVVTEGPYAGLIVIPRTAYDSELSYGVAQFLFNGTSLTQHDSLPYCSVVCNNEQDPTFTLVKPELKQAILSLRELLIQRFAAQSTGELFVQLCSLANIPLSREFVSMLWI